MAGQPLHLIYALQVEREIIPRALAKYGGNRTKAAAYLGIPRHILLYRLEKFGLE